MEGKQLVFRGTTTGRLVTVKRVGSNLQILQEASAPREIPLRQVLSVDYKSEDQTIRIPYLRKKKGPLALYAIEGKVEQSGEGTVEPEAWAEALLAAAYDGVKRKRRVKVVVNPFSGVRKGCTIYNKIIHPILSMSGCDLDTYFTTKGGDAYELARTLTLDFDTVVSVSGDGLVHEILNGFASHEHPTKALDIPIAPIPTGSGNALCCNLLGVEDGFDVAMATLNVVKGHPMKVDVFSFVQGGNRSISFMSQALGMMADLDVGTDHLRWMGESRFLYGLLRGIIHFRPCPVKLSYKLVESDKDRMIEHLQERRHAAKDGFTSPPSAFERYGDELPPLKYADEDHQGEGWATFEEPLLYIYGGKGPYVGRDFMTFPVSLPNDGLLDLCAQTNKTTRGEMLKAIGTAATGGPYWKKSNHYMKVHAYRIKPLSSKGHLAIDGEPFPFEEFHVETHQELATLLSPHGYYAADFHPRTTKS